MEVTVWNKIGDWLGYPDNWCEFVLAILGVLLMLILLAFLGFMLILPAIVWLFITIPDTFAYSIVMVLSCAASLVCWVVLHLTLKEETFWYPNLLNKLPSCPKIKWNKGE
jgi:hypothetical protein